jgi:hypothetical protein
MTYAMICLFLVILIGLGVINYLDTCRTAKKLIRMYGDELL